MKYLEFVKNMLNNYKGKAEEALKFVENIENSHKNKYKDEEKNFKKILKRFYYYVLRKMFELEEIVNNT